MTRSAPATNPPERGDQAGRYSRVPFPPYRHRPGRTPHPRRHLQGHRYGQDEVLPERFDPTLWEACDDYLYGADLYNHGYYWEAHEAWEGLWKTTGRTDVPGRFLQGLIQVAAAVLKRRVDSPAGMRRLARKGMEKLRAVVEGGQQEYCGLRLGEFLEDLGVFFERAGKEREALPPPIVLRNSRERKET